MRRVIVISIAGAIFFAVRFLIGPNIFSFVLGVLAAAAFFKFAEASGLMPDADQDVPMLFSREPEQPEKGEAEHHV